MPFHLFGYTLGKSPNVTKVEDPNTQNLVIPQSQIDDGAITIQQGSYSGTYVDLEGSVRNELELITRYREMSLHPECSEAIEEIITEAVTQDDDGEIVEINLDKLNVSATIKKKIQEGFNKIKSMLSFQDLGEDLFKRWYIDGRLYFQAVIDKSRPKEGLQELRYIDPRKIRKVREILKDRDPATGVEYIKATSEYYVYNDRGLTAQAYTASVNQGTRIATDAIVFVPSGLLDAKSTMVIGWLHKAIKPLNQLRMIEDAVVIYRLSRAPERRIFYIDVGNLPKMKAEQYMKDIMTKYRNKLVYDASTGELRDERKHLSMLEDFWLPRREGSLRLTTYIPLLDGRSETLETLIIEHNLGKQNWTYSVSPEGTIVPGKITWAGVTGYEVPVLKITLDNGESITVTPEHEFIMRNGTKCQAQDLLEGQSLMPYYSRDHKLSAKYSGSYHQIFDNAKQKWVYTHRMVSESMDRPKLKTEVIHHKDFRRYNNNPENLKLMDRLQHFELHSFCGTNAWNNGNREEHCRNLSISNSAFYKTARGIEERGLISERNKINPKVIQGFKNARELVKLHRAHDKLTMPPADYLKKWSPGIAKMQANNEKVRKERQWFLETQFPVVCQEIDKIFHRRLSISEVSQHLSGVYSQTYLHSERAIRDLFKHHGYATYNDYMSQTYQAAYRWRNGTSQHPLHNHKVAKIEWLQEPADVGTLTIDEHHVHHDYHNFAVAPGIFIMNSKGTEIATLPGGDNLGKMEDVEYFQKKLYKSLNVPIGRLDSQSAGGGIIGLGRVAEITRDEVKFNKFIQRLRNKFSRVFDEALKQEMVLTGVCSLEEWENFREEISYTFKNDNNFTELRDAELLRERVTLLQQVQPYIGLYYSNTWVKRHILHLSDEEIEEMGDEIDEETQRGELPLPPPPGSEVPGQLPGVPTGGDQGTQVPFDNTQDTGEEPTESLTPGLDRAVEQQFNGKRTR